MNEHYIKNIDENDLFRSSCKILRNYIRMKLSQIKKITTKNLINFLKK